MQSLDVLMTSEKDLERKVKEINQEFLLIELPFPHRNRTRDAIKHFVSVRRRQSFEDLAHQFPLTFCRWLVAEAADVYQSGALWSQIAQVLEIPPAWTNDCGKAFFGVCHRLHLPTHDEGHHYVATILVHGAVPLLELPDLFNLVKNALDQLPHSASGRQIRYRITGSLAWPYQSKPIIRFLSEAPDVFVDEYLKEMATLVIQGPKEGQRQSLQQGYLYFQWGKKVSPRSKSSSGPPYLRLGLEPYDTSPLVLVLPSRTSVLNTSPWQIDTSLGKLSTERMRGQKLHDGSYDYDAQEINLSAPVSWVKVTFEDHLVMESRLDPLAAVFDPDGTLRKENWLVNQTSYFLLLAPKVSLTDPKSVKSESASFLGNWSGYRLAEITSDEPTLRWRTEGASGAIPMIGHLHLPTEVAIRPGDPAVLTVGGIPSHLNPVSTAFTVQNISQSDGISINLSADEVDYTSNAIALNVLRALPNFGLHRLSVHGPFGISAQVVVDYGPRITLTLSDCMRWPSERTGQHRLGWIAFDYPPEVVLSAEEAWRVRATSPGHSEYLLTPNESRLEFGVQYGNQSYRREWVCRDFSWEWTMDHNPQIVNTPLRVTQEQLLNEHCVFNWHGQADLQADMYLTDDTQVLKALGILTPNHPYSVHDAIQDDISHAAAEIVRLVVRITGPHHETRDFPVAWIHRAVVRDLRIQEKSSKLIVTWHGYCPSNLEGVVASVFGLYSPIRFSAKAVTHQGHEHEVRLPHPDHAGTVVVSLGGGAHYSEKFLGHVRTGHRLPQGTFSRALNQWARTGERPPVPKEFHEYRLWIECLALIPPTGIGRVVTQVVLPGLRGTASHWLKAALSSSAPVKCLFRLGVSQWNIPDQVGTLESRALVQTLSQIQKKSPMYAWLVGNGCFHFYPPLAVSIFGAEGQTIATTLQASEFPTNIRRHWLDLVKSSLFDVALGESAMPPISCDHATWLGSELSAIAESQPVIGDYERWASHALSADEVNIGRLALMQRLVARGLVSKNIIHLLNIQQDLPPGWVSVYERELVRAELLGGLVEYIEQRREHSRLIH